MVWKLIKDADKTSKLYYGWDGDWFFLFTWFPVERRLKENKNCWVKCSGYGDGEPHIMYVDDCEGSDAWWVEPIYCCELPESPLLIR